MSLIFGRRAEVVLERETPLLPLRVASPLRIQFKIEKNPLAPPNTADVSVTNLSDFSRRGLQKFGGRFELRAGYASHKGLLPLLFRGDARTVDNVRKGSEWLTHVQSGDGEIPFRFAAVNQSFPLGVTSAQIARYLLDVLAAAGVDTTAFRSAVDAELVRFVFPQFSLGYATQGNALEELEKLLDPGAYLVSIQSGELRIIPTNGTSTKAAIVLSPSTGLLGSPEHGSPDRNGLPSVLKVRAFLLPHLEPGDSFILRGVDSAGAYRADKLTHTGDTHGDDWTTEIEARGLPQ